MDFIQTSPDKLVLIHGLLCLDFTNTVFWRLREEPREGLQDYATFAKWSQKIGMLPDPITDRLLQEAETHPVEAAIVLRRAIKLREALYRIITVVIEGSQPKAEDLDSLNNEATRMLQRKLLIHKGDFFEWGWRTADNALDQMLWPILHSATELLTSPEMNRIGICRGEGCGWLFYDQSRNRTRKWCDMGDCGNRAKARRFYERGRKKRSTNPSSE
jgi:predicted RNA-binding Zn ribbon-like protein